MRFGRKNKDPPRKKTSAHKYHNNSKNGALTSLMVESVSPYIPCKP